MILIVVSILILIFVRDKVKLTGRPEEIATLHLHTVSPRHSHIEISVEMQDCPPGFMLGDNSECVYNVQSYVGFFFYCDLHVTSVAIYSRAIGPALLILNW